MTVFSSISKFLQHEFMLVDGDSIIEASKKCNRAIRDLQSVFKTPKRDLEKNEKLNWLAKGAAAIAVWAPLHLVAIPHMACRISKRRFFNQKPSAEPINLLISNLYWGSLLATSPEYLEKHGIKHVLSVTEAEVSIDPSITHTQIKVKDFPHIDIAKTFKVAHAFIDNAMSKKEPVLVHCTMGRCRSAAVLGSYLMKEFNVNLDFTMEILKNCRTTEINPGFMVQLRRFEGDLKKLELKQY